MSYKIFVCACDKYDYISDYFLYFAYKVFPDETNLNFFTEEVEGEDKNPIKKGCWYERMLRCLDKLDCEDVIYLQEDFLIKSIDFETVDKIYELHKRKNAHITKLGNNFEFKTKIYPEIINGYQVYLQDPNDTYLMSHQPVAIFNKSFLMQSLMYVSPEGPSEHEIEGSKWMREANKTKVFCVGEPHYPKNYSDIFNFEHAIRKGEILDDAKEMINGLSKYKI